MSMELRNRLFKELDSIKHIDPHSHIDPLKPASKTLADILGYHYFTELAHSAGLPKAAIEEPGLDPKEKVGRLVAALEPLDNTIQYAWFIDLAQQLFGFQDDRLTTKNWESLYDTASKSMSRPTWEDEVLEKSRLTAVFLTNDFDDPLAGFDTNRYIPCLRTDDLVFHLAKSTVRERLQKATGETAANAGTIRKAIGKLFDTFTAKGSRACAISLPPTFSPEPVSDAVANAALATLHKDGEATSADVRTVVSNFVFWTLAEGCAEYKLPFDLMIGVNRGVYADGVYQGQDLFDARCSLIQYRQLLNAFPQVTFPISVLSAGMNHELTSYSWIFPNVVTNGHWWYSNTPPIIEIDTAMRLEAVPKTKQIGYYSDMYKLEFGLPKFSMYKQILAKVLAERFVVDRGWSEDRAIALGKHVLCENTERIFPRRK